MWYVWSCSEDRKFKENIEKETHKKEGRELLKKQLTDAKNKRREN